MKIHTRTLLTLGEIARNCPDDACFSFEFRSLSTTIAENMKCDAIRPSKVVKREHWHDAQLKKLFIELGDVDVLCHYGLIRKFVIISSPIAMQYHLYVCNIPESNYGYLLILPSSFRCSLDGAYPTRVIRLTRLRSQK